MEPAATAWLLVSLGAVSVLAALSTRLSGRSGVPSLLAFLALGLAVRTQPWFVFPAPDAVFSFRLGTIALLLILFDGGLNTPLAAARSVAKIATILATLGVLITAGLTAAIAWLAGLPLPLAALAGAVASSTDAAAVFAALRASHARLLERVGLTLELESGLNDPMAMFLTLVTTEAVLGTTPIGLHTLGQLAWQLVAGALGGLALGLGGRWILVRAQLGSSGLYPILTAALACLGFGVVTIVGGSGFMAVYLGALLLTSGAIPYRSAVRRVHDALAWVSQISVFFVLGLTISPTTLLDAIVPGTLLAITLTLVARPVAVAACLVRTRFTWRERVFIGLAGLRGATPIVLATYPILRGVPGSDRLFAVVFALVVVNAFVPGAILERAARRLGLQRASPPAAPAGLELISGGELDGEFVSYWIAPASAVAGAAVRDIPIPDACLLTLVLRHREVVVPKGDTRLEPGDHVIVFARAADRPLADLLFGQQVT